MCMENAHKVTNKPPAILIAPVINPKMEATVAKIRGMGKISLLFAGLTVATTIVLAIVSAAHWHNLEGVYMSVVLGGIASYVLGQTGYCYYRTTREAINRKLAEELRFIARFGDLVKMKEWLSKGADPNLTDAEGKNALHYALTAPPEKREALLRELYSAGVDLQAVDHQGRNVLHYALLDPSIYRMPIVNMLLEYINPEKPDNDGNTPLHYAFFHTVVSLELVQAFAKRMRMTLTNNHEQTLLHATMWQVANFELEEIVKVLKRDISVEALDRSRRIALHYAYEHNIREDVRELILPREINADINGKYPCSCAPKQDSLDGDLAKLRGTLFGQEINEHPAYRDIYSIHHQLSR